MKKQKNPFILIVSVICAVSLILAGVLFTIQMLPDVVAGGRVHSKGQPYNESWTADFVAGMDFSIDLSSVDVVVDKQPGNTIDINFEGKRIDNGDGEMPSIRMDQNGDSITLREIYREDDDRYLFDWGPWTGGFIDGTLYVHLPEGVFGNSRIDTFSGEITASALNSEDAVFTTSSGEINLADIQSNQNITVETFSGDVMLKGLTAEGTVSADSSSGSVSFADITGARLQHTSFSGEVKAENITVTGDAEFDVSSGSVSVDGLTATNLGAHTFSGSVSVLSTTVSDLARLDTSSGSIDSQNSDMKKLDLSTFSGSINLENTSTDNILVDTSSGSFDARLLTPCDIQAETFSGGVTVFFPENAGFTLNTDTFSGKVSCDFAAMISGDEDEGAFVVGDGSKKLNINTSSGNITIKPLQTASGTPER